MDILVVTGSPKGHNSITRKTAEYLETIYPEHTWHYLDAGAQKPAFEKDFAPVATQLHEADLILFAYPVYTFIAPAPLHRFVELLFENNVDLAGKAVSQITTSKHFYDVTAHTWLKENLADLGMAVYHGLSADMEDLLSETGRQQARSYFDHLLFQIQNLPAPVHKPKGAASAVAPYQSTSSPVPKTKNGKIALVYCGADPGSNLEQMLREFEATCAYETCRVNLDTLGLRGGCRGCLRCALEGKCIYKDGFEDVQHGIIEACDAAVFAFPVQNHFAPAIFKVYNDRLFCNGHRSVTQGQPVGYILSGPYSNENNLRTILEARAQVGGNFLAGVATDEIDAATAVYQLSTSLEYALENKLTLPPNFYGVGGQKIFRDLVYKMQGIMREDHQFFKKTGAYDFPQNDRKTILGLKMLSTMLRLPNIRVQIRSKMDEYMIMPYQKVIDNAMSASR